MFDTAGALSLRECGTMLKSGGVSLHIVPSFAKMVGCLLPSRHQLVFGNPTPQSLAGVAEAAGRGSLALAIGRVVPLSDAIPGDRRAREDRLSQGEAGDRSHAIAGGDAHPPRPRISSAPDEARGDVAAD